MTFDQPPTTSPKIDVQATKSRLDELVESGDQEGTYAYLEELVNSEDLVSKEVMVQSADGKSINNAKIYSTKDGEEIAIVYGYTGDIQLNCIVYKEENDAIRMVREDLEILVEQGDLHALYLELEKALDGVAVFKSEDNEKTRQLDYGIGALLYNWDWFIHINKNNIEIVNREYQQTIYDADDVVSIISLSVDGYNVVFQNSGDEVIPREASYFQGHVSVKKASVNNDGIYQSETGTSIGPEKLDELCRKLAETVLWIQYQKNRADLKRDYAATRELTLHTVLEEE